MSCNIFQLLLFMLLFWAYILESPDSSSPFHLSLWTASHRFLFPLFTQIVVWFLGIFHNGRNLEFIFARNEKIQSIPYRLWSSQIKSLIALFDVIYSKEWSGKGKWMKWNERVKLLTWNRISELRLLRPSFTEHFCERTEKNKCLDFEFNI